MQRASRHANCPITTHRSVAVTNRRTVKQEPPFNVRGDEPVIARADSPRPVDAAPPRPALFAAAPWAVQGLFWIALIAFAKEAEPVLAPIVVALTLAFLLSPAVQALRRIGLHAAVAAAIVVVSMLAGLGLLTSTLAAPAAQWWERTPVMVAQLFDRIDQLRATVLRSTRPAPAAAVGNRIARPSDAAADAAKRAAPDPLRDQLASEGVALTGTLLKRTVSVSVSIAATVILLYFLLVSEPWIVSRTIEAFPRRRTRARVLCLLRRAQRDIGLYIGTLGLIYSVVGALTMVCMAAFGLPNPLLWGVITVVLNFVPYIGPVVIATLLLLAALVSFEPGAAVLAPAGAFVLIHAIESNFVSPWFMGQRLMLSPLSIFVSVLFWGWLWGMTGALIAVPVLVGVRSLCKHSRRWRLLCVFLEGGRPGAPTLHSLLTRRTQRARQRPTG